MFFVGAFRHPLRERRIVHEPCDPSRGAFSAEVGSISRGLVSRDTDEGALERGPLGQKEPSVRSWSEVDNGGQILVRCLNSLSMFSLNIRLVKYRGIDLRNID